MDVPGVVTGTKRRLASVLKVVVVSAMMGDERMAAKLVVSKVVVSRIAVGLDPSL